MAMGNLAAIVAALKQNGLPGDKPVAIVREGTKPTQETLVATLDTIVAEVERTKFAAPAVVVIGDVVNERAAIRWFDTGPLFAKRVLVTRPAAQAADFSARLWELGAEPIAAPTIAIGPPDDPAAAAAAVERVRDYTWVIFTSRNGVDAFFDRLSERGRDARALGDTNVAAIGPQTAAALAAHGIRVDFMPARFINEAVADGMLARTRTGDRAAGRVVDDVAAYKTRPVIDPELADKAASADILTFTSSGTVTGFITNVPDAAALCAPKIVACIGPVTAATARDAGIRVDVVADAFTIDGLMRALDSAVSA
jgi:uroporphyrinogen III methyltransferase/synthase